jgi:hypothetical protein
MPFPAAPRRPKAKSKAKSKARPAPESFVLKTLLVMTALILGAFVFASEGIYLSAPGRSLSEVEASLLLAKHGEASAMRTATRLSD